MNNNNIFEKRVRPWDGIGTPVMQANSWEEVMELAGLDWNVRQEDVYAGEGIRVPGYKANIKDDDNTVLGVVSTKYNLVQHSEAYAFLDELFKQGARFDCAGVLQAGKRTWVSMKLSNYIINGERHVGYLLITNSFDGSSSLRISVVPVRVLCANTISLALKKAQRTWALTHSASVNEKLEAAKEVLLHADAYMESLGKEIEWFNKKIIPEEEAMSIIDELMPITDDMSQVQRNNTTKLRNDIKYRYRYAPDLVGMNNTAYRLYNAISDHAFHSEPLRRTENYKESLFIKAIDGNPLLDKAYEMIKAA
ncbi:MAG: DUF932 domain-containing protein [Lachnospiraceae bacterium]|nr:DUF932 domain-containing protein [Lachnospiraceae bacterium]